MVSLPVSTSHMIPVIDRVWVRENVAWNLPLGEEFCGLVHSA